MHYVVLVLMMSMLVVLLKSLPLTYYFFFNDTAPTEIYPLPLHDALPISGRPPPGGRRPRAGRCRRGYAGFREQAADRRRLDPLALAFAQDHVLGPEDMVLREGQRQWRSEEHTSELQSHLNLVCRLLLEKK